MSPLVWFHSFGYTPFFSHFSSHLHICTTPSFAKEVQVVAFMRAPGMLNSTTDVIKLLVFFSCNSFGCAFSHLFSFFIFSLSIAFSHPQVVPFRRRKRNGTREKNKKNTFVRVPERKGVTINHLNNLYFVFAFIVQFIWKRRTENGTICQSVLTRHLCGTCDTRTINIIDTLEIIWHVYLLSVRRRTQMSDAELSTICWHSGWSDLSRDTQQYMTTTVAAGVVFGVPWRRRW